MVEFRADQIEMLTEELGLETVMICEMEKGGKGSMQAHGMQKG